MVKSVKADKLNNVYSGTMATGLSLVADTTSEQSERMSAVIHCQDWQARTALASERGIRPAFQIVSR
jgi:exopolysaccharide biosynthesis protein